MIRNYDAIGRLSGVQNNTTSANYVSSIAYNAANEVTGFTYGNSVTASFGYSAERLQLTSLSYTQNSQTIFSLSYGYTQNSGNNGQKTQITDNVQSGRSVTYTYDSLKRLKTAVTNGSTPYPQWGLSWTYDRYGNRTQQSVTHGSGPSNSVTVSSSTNQITEMASTTFQYDSNGNLTQDDLYKYKYDAENRLVELRLANDTLVATYTMDGNGLRVLKSASGLRTWSIYDGTKLISEFEDSASATYTSGTTPGAAPSDGNSTLLYQHADHLTTRFTTDNSGVSANQQAHHPYGEIWYNTGDADPSVTRKFTSYSRESEAASGKLYYAKFREHSGRVGRFLMADPVRGNAFNPQRLNRYAYVQGDPTNRVDPNGLDDWDIGPCGGGECIVQDVFNWGTPMDLAWTDATSKLGGILGGSGPVGGWPNPGTWGSKGGGGSNSGPSCSQRFNSCIKCIGDEFMRCMAGVEILTMLCTFGCDVLYPDDWMERTSCKAKCYAGAVVRGVGCSVILSYKTLECKSALNICRSIGIWPAGAPC